MASERKRERTRDLLLGGVLGAFAAVAALRRRPARRTTTVGLAAFEDAPCFREAVEAETAAHRQRA